MRYPSSSTCTVSRSKPYFPGELNPALASRSNIRAGMRRSIPHVAIDMRHSSEREVGLKGRHDDPPLQVGPLLLPPPDATLTIEPRATFHARVLPKSSRMRPRKYGSSQLVGGVWSISSGSTPPSHHGCRKCLDHFFGTRTPPTPEHQCLPD